MPEEVNAIDYYAERTAIDLIRKGESAALKWFEENQGQAIGQVVYSEYRERLRSTDHA